MADLRAALPQTVTEPESRPVARPLVTLSKAAEISAIRALADFLPGKAGDTPPEDAGRIAFMVLVLTPNSARARTPVCEQVPKISTIDLTISVQVANGGCGCRPPLREQRTEVGTIDLAVNKEISDALARIRNTVDVEVGSTSGEFTGITDAVTVAVGLRRILDERTVVDRIGDKVTVNIRRRKDEEPIDGPVDRDAEAGAERSSVVTIVLPGADPECDRHLSYGRKIDRASEIRKREAKQARRAVHDLGRGTIPRDTHELHGDRRNALAAEAFGDARFASSLDDDFAERNEAGLTKLSVAKSYALFAGDKSVRAKPRAHRTVRRRLREVHHDRLRLDAGAEGLDRANPGDAEPGDIAERRR